MERDSSDSATIATPARDDMVAWLFSRLDYERKPPGRIDEFRLERMRHLLGLLGDPHLAIPCVHIAGTKGKGSTAAMTAAILQAGRYRTGLFTSPHLNHMEERFRVDGQLPNEAEMAELIAKVRECVPQLESRFDSGPTFFELTTAIAWLRFVQAECDIAVMEVGLGGRLDTTNLCRPEVCIITNISYDHTELLGETLAEIAAEKAGIIKPGVPVVSGVIEPSAAAVIGDTSVRSDAPLFQPASHDDADTSSIAAEWNQETGMITVELLGRRLSAPVPLAGEHQAKNAALAIAASMLLEERDWRIPETAIVAGLSAMYLPLRIELLSSEPVVIVDAAHNTASIDALGRTLVTHFPQKKRVLIFGTSRDKNLRGMLKLIADFADEVVVAQYSNNPRAVPVEDVQTAAESAMGRPVPMAVDLDSAWKQAAALAGDDGLICCTGSFFLAAEFREWFLSKE